MRPFTLLVKPASADCNLRCDYCFYLDRGKLYPEGKTHRMPDDVLDAMISKYMATPQPQYAFGWQGGEPTLMGAGFFRRVTELQEKRGARGARVANGLQTNATLIDDELARHLATYKFLVGVSLDGPADVHDRHRRNAAGRGSHTDVLRGIDRLRRRHVEFNILTLVNEANVGRGSETYRYLRDRGLLFHQYIPCVEFDERGERMPFAIDGPAWGGFLCEIFDEWFTADTRRVSVRLFDSLLAWMVEGRRTTCTMGRNCRQYLVVEHNGDVYPCDFFVEQGLRLGNILTDDWEGMLDSPVYAAFGADKAKWAAECDECRWLDVCAGDCLKHRYAAGRDPRRLSHLCEGWKRFYAHAMDKLGTLADDIRTERAQPAAPKPVTPPDGEVGRNDPCPCGSGRKLKNCCGRGR